MAHGTPIPASLKPTPLVARYDAGQGPRLGLLAYLGRSERTSRRPFAGAWTRETNPARPSKSVRT
jgi:hypothetical protein